MFWADKSTIILSMNGDVNVYIIHPNDEKNRCDFLANENLFWPSESGFVLAVCGLKKMIVLYLFSKGFCCLS